MRLQRLALACVPLLTGCGAIMAPGPFPVLIESHPSGATVLYEGNAVGSTPCTVAVRRSAREVELVLDGCQRQRVDLGVVNNRWVAGNISNLGLGMLIDVALGTDKHPDTAPAMVYLGPAVGPERPTWVRYPAVAEPATYEITSLGRMVAGILLAATRSQERR